MNLNYNFKLVDFISEGTREYILLDQEDLHGPELIDNLIYLRFMSARQVQQCMASKYGINFTWIRQDITPPEFEEIAAKYKVIIHKAERMTIYIPFGVTFDVSELEVDIPNYEITYKYISNINYRILKTNRGLDVISNKVIEIRPKLLLRRILLDCLRRGGTDTHFVSRFNEMKLPEHLIEYRIKRRLEPSEFKVDWDVTQSLIQTAVAKLSNKSAQDLDSLSGVTTELADIFLDGTSEVRMTVNRSAAGYYAVMAIQTTDTTLMTIDQLGLPTKDTDKIRTLAHRRTGLTLVTGEMRSGKNTTIFAMLNEIKDDPIRIVSYENPIENRMPFPQVDYKGDIDVLKACMMLAKKEDIDIAMLNEIPNAEVAFAVRDLVNSAIGVFTTTHVDRVWHTPYKLREFFGNDYKTVISQLNAVITQKMFRRWESPNMQKRLLNRDDSEFHAFCWRYGVTQYFQPEEGSEVKYHLQPLVEIMEFDDSMKTAMENFDEIWRAEQMIKSKADNEKSRLEYRLAEYINMGICSLEEMRDLL